LMLGKRIHVVVSDMEVAIIEKTIQPYQTVFKGLLSLCQA